MADSFVGAHGVIRSSFGTRVLWSLILIGAGIVVFFLAAGGAAARLQWWIASLVAVAEVIAHWRVFRVALVLDDVGVTVRNYLRDYRIQWSELAGIEIVKEETESTKQYDQKLLPYLLDYLSERTLYGAALRFPDGRSLNARATFRAKVNSSIISTLQAHASRYGIPFSSQEIVAPASLTTAAAPPLGPSGPWDLPPVVSTLPRSPRPRASLHDRANHWRNRVRDALSAFPRTGRPRASLHDRANHWLNWVRDDEGTGYLFMLIGIPELVLLAGIVIVGNLPVAGWQFWLLAGVSFFALPVIAALYMARLVARATPRLPLLSELAAGLTLLIAILGTPFVILVAYNLLMVVAPIR